MNENPQIPVPGKWKLYPSYKRSGVEWLGEVPDGWDVTRIKTAIYLQRGYDLDSTKFIEGEYPVCGSNGVIGFHNEFRSLGPGITIGRSGSVGEVNYIRTDYWPHNTAIYVKKFHGTYPRFMFFLLKIIDIKSVSEGSVVGTLNRNNIHNLAITLPPLPDQTAIATFLDRETARIDALIEKKERLIALLEEKRAALISHAVTKGRDPDAKMKDSGVEWIGEVPVGWSVIKLKVLADVRGGVTKGRDLTGKLIIEVPYLRVANVQDGFVNLSDITNIEIGEDELERYSLKQGDILMNEGGDKDKLGRGAIWMEEIKPCVHQNHVFAVRPYNMEYSQWTDLITLSSYAKFYFALMAKQTTNLASISATNIKELPITLPPKEIRNIILDYILENNSLIESIISAIKKSLDILKEYRSALISAAVTGKIDVRPEVIA